MIRRLLLNLAERTGYEVRRAPLPNHGTDAEFDRILGIVRHNTMLSRARLLSLYEQVRYCELANVPGAFVECGVWKGGAVGLMALASDRGRHLHLFDSFTDICEPDCAVDGHKAIGEARGQATGALRPLSGFYDGVGGCGTVSACRQLLEDAIGYDPAMIHINEGWFQNTVPASQTGPIAILRLDGDWYASTKVCLDHLFDRVVPGGFVIFDDYGTYDGCKRAVDEFFAKRSRPFTSAIDCGCYYMVKASEPAQAAMGSCSLHADVPVAIQAA